MKVREKSKEFNAIKYDGSYQKYLEIFDEIRKYTRNSTISTWERNVPVYYFDIFYNQKTRILEGDWVLFFVDTDYNGRKNVYLKTFSDEEFEEKYEIVE